MKNCQLSKPPVAANDHLRVQSLHDLHILDTPEEEEYNNIVLLAASICHTPIAMISLIDETRQWFKAKIGVRISETPREISFCGHAIAEDTHFFQVEDATLDTRFFENPLVVSGPRIRFYAGVQLIGRRGYKVGMLCVNDIRPNALTDNQIFALQVLADVVSKLMDLRYVRRELVETTSKLQLMSRSQERLLNIMAHDSELFLNAARK